MEIRTADRLGQVEEYYFSKKLREVAALRAAGHDVINLGIGSPDLPPHPAVIRTLSEVAAQTGSHGYQGYRGLPELRTAFADWYGRYFGVHPDPDSEVLPLIGSKEGIMHISMTYLQAGDEVLLPNPGYPTYAAVGRLTGATLRYYDLRADRQWQPDFEALERTDLSRIKLMWVNYPHMPTGAAASVELFKRIVDFGKRHNILIVNDNPYAFILNERPLSILSVPGAMEVALELNSLSKCLNMAGWRVGAVVGAADRLQEILRFKSNMDSGMFRPVQLAAARALQLDEEWYNSLNGVYRERREAARAFLQALHCSVAEHQYGMFLLGGLPEGYENGYQLADELLDRYRIFLTPGGIFGSNTDRYVRISLCSPVEVFEAATARLTTA